MHISVYRRGTCFWAGHPCATKVWAKNRERYGKPFIKRVRGSMGVVVSQDAMWFLCFTSHCSSPSYSSSSQQTSRGGSCIFLVSLSSLLFSPPTSSLGSNPGSLFRILSHSFGEKSEGEPGRILHMLRWHRDVHLPDVKGNTSHGMFMLLPSQCWRSEGKRCKTTSKTTELPGVRASCSSSTATTADWIFQ